MLMSMTRFATINLGELFWRCAVMISPGLAATPSFDVWPNADDTSLQTEDATCTQRDKVPVVGEVTEGARDEDSEGCRGADHAPVAPWLTLMLLASLMCRLRSPRRGAP